MRFFSPLTQIAAATALALLAGCATPTGTTDPQSGAASGTPTVRIQQIRNATLKIEYAGTRFLVDPMLAKKGAYPGFPGTYNSELRNPLVELPLPLDEVMRADAVIVTHTHLDHWDDAAKQSLPKSIPVFAQNETDAQAIRKDGFTDVRVLGAATEFKGVHLTRTGGQHGSDAMMVSPAGALLGQVSGIVFQRPGHKTVYIAGDTIWRPEVDQAIWTYQPDVIVLNTGYARLQGFDGSIIMGKDDLSRAYQAAPRASIIGSHMEAVNHMMQSRADLRAHIKANGMDAQRVLVPEDGQAYQF